MNSHSRASRILLTVLTCLSLSACISLQSPTTPVPQNTPIPTPGDKPAITLYFTDPASGATTGGPGSALADAVKQASKSVDMAIYNFSLPALEEALIAAERRGVNVRMVMESDNLENASPTRLSRAGIPITGDLSEASMHDKFAVIDGVEVWTGSMNFTTASAYEDENNLARIESTDLAAAYEAEFEEMYTARKFGASSPAETPLPALTIGGDAVEVLFSPDDNPARRILQVLRGAQKSISFLAYSFTSDSLAQAILDRAAQGVTVSGVMDAEQAVSNTGGEYENFRQAGLDVHLDGIPGLMHHKVIVVDAETVIFGSYNFSNNAETRNDENLLIIQDAQIAASFLEAFQRIQAEAEP